MGNYEELKAAVSSVIKTNGNQEITGQVLQNTLTTLISQVGANATFAGIATPDTAPGTPDQNVFYIASENGIYSNFNGITLSNEVSIFSNRNGSWEKYNTGLATQQQLSELIKHIGTKGDFLIKYLNNIHFDNSLCRISKDGFYLSNSTYLFWISGNSDYIADVSTGRKLLVIDLNILLENGRIVRNESNKALYILINWNEYPNVINIVDFNYYEIDANYTRGTNYIVIGSWDNTIYTPVNACSLNYYLNRHNYEVSFFFNDVPSAFFSGNSIVFKEGFLLRPKVGRYYYIVGERRLDLSSGNSWFLDLSVLVNANPSKTTEYYDEIDINTEGLIINDVNIDAELTKDNPGFLRLISGYSSRNIRAAVLTDGLFSEFINTQRDINNSLTLFSLSDDISFVNNKVYIKKRGFRLQFPSTNRYILVEEFNDTDRSILELPYANANLVCINLDVLFTNMKDNGYYYTIKLDTEGLFTIVNYSLNLDGLLPLYNMYYGNMSLSGGLFSNVLCQQGKSGVNFENSYKYNSADTLSAISPYLYSYDLENNKRTKRFNIAFVTDCHIESHPNATENLQEAIKFLNSKPIVGSIDYIINGGDNVSGQQSGEKQRSDMRLFTAINKLSTVSVLPVVGNHDNNYWLNDGSANYMADCISPTEMKEILIEPLVGNVDNAHTVSNNTYYYVDNTEYKIRLIILNCMDVPLVEGVDGRNKYGGLRIYTQAQIDWLVNTALEIPEGYGVIICNHTIPTYIYAGSDFPQGVNTIPEIIDAFKHGKNINKTFNDTSGNGFDISVNKDFSQKGPQNFMFWLAGHYHRDMVTENGTYTDQKIIVGINCGCVQEGDITRIPDNTTKIGFNILCIEKEKRKIYKCLYGAWQNSEGTNKRVNIIDF